MKKLWVILIPVLVCCISCKKEKDDEPIDYEWVSLDYRVPIGNIDDQYMMNAPMRVFFRNMKTGFISAPFETFDSYVSLFLKTDDSCKTFVDLSEQVEGRVTHVSFVSDSIVYLITDQYFLYKSTNGGNKWTRTDARWRPILELLFNQR